MSHSSGYSEGFETGLRWKDVYRPGGPWVCTPRPKDYRIAENMERCRQSKQHHDDWHEGFNAALIIRGIKL